MKPTTPGGFGPMLRYKFDLALSRGPLVVIGYLGLVMLTVILLATVIVFTLRVSGVNGQNHLSFAEAFWQSVLRVLDSGTFAGDTGWGARIVSLVVTLAGIFLAGSLIGLIANAVDQKISDLRKGRSAVLESGHTLVLGWSPRLPVILSELVIANENHKKQALVVLAQAPKDEMEDELRLKVPDTKTTRVVCRTGDPSRANDLALVNVAAARSIIVLAGEDGDAGVVKAVLALRSLDPGFQRAHVVAELENAEHAHTLRALTDGRIVTVQADEVIAEVTAQACHQGGLSAVFRDLLDFDGDEIYFTEIPELVGRTYREAVLGFEKSAVMGRMTAAGAIELNPPPEMVFGAGDQVIAVSEDDDTVVFGGITDPPPVEVEPGMSFTEPPQKIVVVGWSPLGPQVLHELDDFLSPGSSIDLVVEADLVDCDNLDLPTFENCEINIHPVEGGPGKLLELARGATYDQAIVLGYRRELTISEADARTMLTLLTLHKAWGELPSPPRVVAEMLDRGNVEIAQTTGVNDLIVSDELSSLMMAQLSEHIELGEVFAELFDSDGCFVSLRPAPLYAPAHPVAFASVVAAASNRGETALGYRIAATNDVVLNPEKSVEIDLGAGDQVLVLGLR
ncbi:MAG: TrkA-N domain protein [Acidimicrobiales bacterium]|nr:TrkA-N domain protein [Acidimicrobiales bacterium]